MFSAGDDAEHSATQTIYYTPYRNDFVLKAWILLLVGLGGLASMRIAYNTTYEPAPSIRVRWRDGTPGWQRRMLEMKYRLGDGSRPEGLSIAYALCDTSRGNIMAMVKDRAVADTNDVDRRAFEVPWATAHGSSRMMWAADRMPVVRQPLVRAVLIASFFLMALWGLYSAIRLYPWRAHAVAVVAFLKPPGRMGKDREGQAGA